MTNKEKANEVAENESRFYRQLESNELTSSKIDCKKSALEMAKWKDEQYEKAKALIFDMACDSYCVNCPSSEDGECYYIHGVCDNYINFHDEFKERLKSI